MNTYLAITIYRNIGMNSTRNHLLCSIYSKPKSTHRATGEVTAKIKNIVYVDDDYKNGNLCIPYKDNNGDLCIHFYKNVGFCEVKKFKSDDDALLWFELERRL